MIMKTSQLYSLFILVAVILLGCSYDQEVLQPFHESESAAMGPQARQGYPNLEINPNEIEPVGKRGYGLIVDPHLSGCGLVILTPAGGYLVPQFPASLGFKLVAGQEVEYLYLYSNNPCNCEAGPLIEILGIAQTGVRPVTDKDRVYVPSGN